MLTTEDQCFELQKEELEVLESIYPDYASDISKSSVTLEVPIELDAPYQIIIEDISKVDNSTQPTLNLSILPSLLIHVILPEAYPIAVPPQLVSIRSTYLWMPYISQLHQLLVDMWQSEAVLYNWIEFIRSGQFLEKLGMAKDNGVILIRHSTPQLLVPLLTGFESSARSNEFNRNSYPCSVCLSSFKGSKCLRLSCGHVFCRTCLKDFWGLCITEGEVSRVGCPDPQCVKEGRQADEEEVARAVSEETVARWRWLKEKAMMDSDPTISICPMILCQKPVPKPHDITANEESGWHRLRTCLSCSYSFCSFCKRTWHGPVSACPISAYETLVLDYLALPEDSLGRKTIEHRFGRSILAKMIATYHDEQACKQWLQDSATPCPGCNIHIEKSLGCNHMICTKCKQHFCYRCGVKLQAATPYQHFSTSGSSCFNKLFDFQSSEEDEWQPIAGFNAL